MVGGLWSAKRWNLPLVGVAVLLAAPFQSRAALAGLTPVTPGSTQLVGAVTGAPGVLLASLSSPFSFSTTSGVTSGTLITAVYRNGANLDFYYQIVNSPTSATPIARETDTNFVGFTTAVGFRLDGAAVAPFVNGTIDPLTADVNAPGTVVGFQFGPPDSAKIQPGQTSDVFVISTNATSFTAGNATFIDGGSQTVAAFQPTAGLEDVFQIRYAAHLDAGDSFVDITNAGTLSGVDPAGRICVNVYTFDPAEELVSCCSCPVTPNGLVSLSVRNDLISNTLTPGVPTSVTIKLLSSVPVAGACNASSPTSTNLARGMRAWGTTIHPVPGGPPAFGTTETPFLISQLSPSELNKLTSFCGFIQSNGSGFGICRSCRTGALGGETK